MILIFFTACIAILSIAEHVRFEGEIDPCAGMLSYTKIGSFYNTPYYN